MDRPTNSIQDSQGTNPYSNNQQLDPQTRVTQPEGQPRSSSHITTTVPSQPPLENYQAPTYPPTARPDQAPNIDAGEVGWPSSQWVHKHLSPPGAGVWGSNDSSQSQNQGTGTAHRYHGYSPPSRSQQYNIETPWLLNQHNGTATHHSPQPNHLPPPQNPPYRAQWQPSPSYLMGSSPQHIFRYPQPTPTPRSYSSSYDTNHTPQLTESRRRQTPEPSSRSVSYSRRQESERGAVTDTQPIGVFPTVVDANKQKARSYSGSDSTCQHDDRYEDDVHEATISAPDQHKRKRTQSLATHNPTAVSSPSYHASSSSPLKRPSSLSVRHGADATSSGWRNRQVLPGQSTSTPQPLPEDKEERKKQQNRDSAKRFREKIKARLAELEGQVEGLQIQLFESEAKIRLLERERDELIQQNYYLSQKISEREQGRKQSSGT